MEGFLISLLVAFIAIIVLYKLAKGIFKIVATLFFILIVVLLIFTALIFKDISDIQDNASQKNTMLLLKGEKIVAGITFSPQTELSGLSENDIPEANRNYAEKNYEALKKDSYKLFIVDYEPIAAPIEISGKTISKEEVSSMLDGNSTSQQTKNLFFSMLYAEKISSEPMFFITGYKKEEIEIYPESALMKFIKYVPLFVISQASKVSSSEVQDEQEKTKVEYEKIK
jgi:Ca2+/Na+ antiporter